MVRAGHSPSVRLFEAGACGTPIISDYWKGLGSIFDIGSEILVARNADDTQRLLTTTTEDQRLEIGDRLRRRILREHTYQHRAEQLAEYALELIERPKVAVRRSGSRRV
jgi:spore maturation protein CgeB